MHVVEEAQELGAFGQPEDLVQVRGRLVELEVVDQAPRDVDVRAARVLDVVDGEGHLQGLEQRAKALATVVRPEGHSEVVQGVRQRGAVAGFGGQVDGASRQPGAVVAAMGERGQLSLVAERPREQTGIAGLGQNRTGLLGRLLRLRPATREPEEPGQPAQAQSECASVGMLATQLDRGALGDDRGVCCAGVVALDGVGLQQLELLRRRIAIEVVQRPLELGDGLSVRAGRRGLPGRHRRVPDDGVHLAGLRGVVHQLAGTRLELLQGGEHAPVELDPASDRHGVHDGSAGQLVPEGHLIRTDGQQTAFLGVRECRARVDHQRTEKSADRLRSGRPRAAPPRPGAGSAAV